MASALNRREFLKMTASGAMLAGLARKAAPAADDAPGEWRNKRPEMSYRRLGRTNFMISEMVCGGNTISPTSYKHVVAAFDLGLNYFDTAIQYGRGASERGYAKALQEVGRHNVFLATKTSPWIENRKAELQAIYDSLDAAERKSVDLAVLEELDRRRALDVDYICHYFPRQRPALESSVRCNIVNKRFGHKIEQRRNWKQEMIDQLDGSLRSLETDHVDIVICPHAANSYDETQIPEIFEAFEEIKKAGKARHLGVSGHTDMAGILHGAVDSGRYSMAMVAYSIVNAGYMQEALDAAHQADLGVIAMKVARPVHHGRDNGLSNDPRRVAMIERHNPDQGLHIAQKCYLWALEDPRIAACNSELINLELVEANVPLGYKA
jgi:aryl-alcohol dehydrogenase-like predicted oxidoreductase